MRNKWTIKTPQGERVEMLQSMGGVRVTKSSTAMFDYKKVEKLLKNGSVQVISTTEERS